MKRVVFGNLKLKRRRRKTGSNFTTFQCRDVVASRRLNVATSRRCNIPTSSRFLPQNHKKQMEPNDGGIEECMDWGTKTRAVVTRIIGKDTVFVFLLFFDKLLMIYRLMCIFSFNMF